MVLWPGALCTSDLPQKGTLARMGDLSPHFSRREFDTHDGTRVPADVVDDYVRLCRLVLEPLRARFGVCTVTSGYRHPAYNRSIGGAQRSVHMCGRGGGLKGVAADVHFAHGTTSQWHEQADALLRRHYPPGAGLGLYPGQWIHVDTRNYEARWTGAS